MQKRILFFILLTSCCLYNYAQNSKIDIKALLLTDTDQLAIQQRIVYYNKSNSVMKSIVLHNWPNSYRGKETVLAKRLIENYSKAMYVSDSIERGNTEIFRCSANYNDANYRDFQGNVDILEILLNNDLQPKDSVILTINYRTKIPSTKFTGYGKNADEDYILRHWYLTPAIYENNQWKAYNNIDIDHMYMEVMDYNIDIHTPLNYHINTDLYSTKKYGKNLANYNLRGKNRVDIQLNITKDEAYTKYQTDNVVVLSNMDNELLPMVLKNSVINREIAFIEKKLGKFPHKKIMIDRETASKNKVYGLDVPKFLSDFSDVFMWDISFFKALSRKMIDEMIIVNKNDSYWLSEGLQIYLLMEYCEEFYPENKILGNLSDVWGLRKMDLTQKKFNEKYPYVYQFSAQKNLDQALTTRIDSLSNFNRKIVSPYKAGLGLRYLENYLEPGVFKKSLLEFMAKDKFKTHASYLFEKVLYQNSKKDLNWFFGDYLQTNKKIDYTIKKINVNNDSVYITIKNKKNITVPVALYGIKDKKIKWKKWVSNVDSIKTIAVKKGAFDRVSLNYENLYPESNLDNNWKNVTPKLFERPLQLKLYKDLANPHYTQIFYVPKVNYNYYDGLILGVQLNNKAILGKNFEYKLVPTYSLKSNNTSGSFSFNYNLYPENRSFYKFTFGVSGSSFHYDRDFRYSTFNPSATIYFNRKSLRTPGNNYLRVKFHMIDKEIEPGLEKSNEDKYNLLKFTYSYSKPELLNDFRVKTDLEIASHFNKVSTEIRYRFLTKKNRQFDFRWYTGIFIDNNTDFGSNYFSFGMSKPRDYLFEYNMFGREEDAGFLYQQYIIAEGGFKAFFQEENQKYANQWMSTFNTSFNVWNWLEIYNDIGFMKSEFDPLFFAYESGLRLNFMHEIFELYLPVYSNNGWEFMNYYNQKIRFTLTLQPLQIFNSARRGFL